ncbi:MAG: hypothetical protein OXU20_34375 [Myxococcales bacterium]|nr:hypothetical protein [Myxococcales bacterium]
MNRGRLLACVAISNIFLLACGDDNDTGASGVEQSKPANEATEAEVMQVCETVTKMQSTAQECTAWASEDSDTSDECEEKRDNCIARADDDDDDDDACHGDDIKEDLADCDGVTVGDIERCFTDYIAMQNALSCDDPLGKELEPPACLKEIVEKCPGFMDGDDDDDEEERSEGRGRGDGDSSSSFSCEEDDISADGVDCEALCTPLAAAGCGPTMSQCMFFCAEAKTACPTALERISGCAAFEDVTWVCDQDDDLDLEGGCGPELLCFGQCVDRTGDE